MSLSSSNSWKNYGGTYKNDKLQNVSIGTLVADNIILRQDYASEFVVQGNIVVLGDASYSGNAYYSGNTFTKYLFCRDDTYINGNLYIGTNDINKNPNYAYVHGNLTNIGINTTNPLSVFDIVGQNDVSNVLTVRSRTNENYNIISENNQNHGIVAYVGDINNKSVSNIQFYNSSGKSINSNNPDGKIGFIRSSTSLNGFLGMESQNIQIDSSYTNINSKTIFSTQSGNGIKKTFFGETVIIYDSSNRPFLYDFYNDTSIQTGNAMSLVSIDNSSNTSLRIISPNLQGLDIGGGTYPIDSKRAFGYIGINSLDANGNSIYNQTQTIVSGKSKTKYKSTLGINTYSPKTENYVLDINGPTHIGNGELTVVLDANFEVTNMKFSRTNPNYGIICGWPTTQSSPYELYTSHTTDGGITWSNLNRIDSTLTRALETRPRNMCCYVLDEKYSIIGSTNGFIGGIYITNDGGNTWISLSLTISDNTVDIPHFNYSSFFIFATLNNTKRVFFSGTNEANNNIVYQCYFDINFLSPTQTQTCTILGSGNINTINTSDGYANKLYFVGSGILSYNIQNTTHTSYISTGTSNVYNNIFAFNSNYAVAVGSNLISYTTNGGTTWTDVTNIVGNMNSVVLYDLKNGIAVGNNGIIYYTSDGSVTWNLVPDSLLNSSGISQILTGPNNNLTNVVMQDINSFLISNTIQNNNIISPTQNNPGKSKLLYGFYPNLFNRTNNSVLDVSGNMAISGDINVDNNLNIGGNTSINNNLYVTGNINSQSTVNSQYIDSLSNSLYIGPCDNPSQTIYIGTKQYSNAVSQTSHGKTIVIGNDYDTILMKGNVINEQTVNVIYNSKTITLNDTLNPNGTPSANPASSEHSGLWFADHGDISAGYFLVSNNKDGFLLKPTSTDSNTVKLDINSMTFNSNINTGLVVLKKTQNTSDSDYTMTLQQYIDTSNILIRDKSQSTDSTQVISSNLTINPVNTFTATTLVINGTISQPGNPIYQF